MLNGSRTKGSFLGKRAVVIGAGFSGLSAAAALADFFEEVIVLERDELSDQAIARPGVPQGKQAHGILGGAAKGLEELFPGFERDLLQAGAVPVNPGSDVLLESPDLDPFPLREWGWFVCQLSRPLLEVTMRHRVEKLGNVRFHSGAIALKILGTPDGTAVAGVRYQTLTGTSETLTADFIVDASRHGALTQSFLKAAGWRLPSETTIGVDIRYATALFQLEPGAIGEFKAVVTYPKAPEEVHFGYLLPVEHGCFQLLLVGRGEDTPPADGKGFLEYARRKLRTPTIYDALRGAKRLSEVARYAFPESKWRHFGKLDRFPQGLVPIGDAICLLNPIYGQGMALAAQEANALRRLLATYRLNESPFSTLAHQFLVEAESLVQEPWIMSAIPDFIYPQTRGERPEDLQNTLKSQGALNRLATRDADVYELLGEVRHLLKPMSVLSNPDLVSKVEAMQAEMATT